MQLHILGLAHTVTSKRYQLCAYTSKVFKLCSMMTNKGYRVFHYGAEGSDPFCYERVEVISSLCQQKVYGNYDWTREMFKHDGKDGAYQEFNRNAIMEIRKRAQPGDFLLCPMGTYQKPIADALPDLLPVEMGIGYYNVFARAKVFESFAVMNYILGRTHQGRQQSPQVDFYNIVIPNFFDVDDFGLCKEKSDYFLFMGRVIPQKGIGIAVEVTKRIGAKLIVAGQGTLAQCGISADHVEHIGSVTTPEERKNLLGHARAVFVPTLYLEPFGGVAVEAMLCGTPVITTDFGAFTETVPDGLVGYRCNSMEEFTRAARNIDRIRPQDCFMWAYQNYSTIAVEPQYDRYFQRLRALQNDTAMDPVRAFQELGASSYSERVLTREEMEARCR